MLVRKWGCLAAENRSISLLIIYSYDKIKIEN